MGTARRTRRAAGRHRSDDPAHRLPNTWDPGIPGGIPADDDPVRPATVWLPAGNPHDGYSVDPALTGTANAAAFTTAFQAAINAAGAAATPTARKIVRLKTGTYFVNPQLIGGRTVGILVTVDNVTIVAKGPRARVSWPAVRSATSAP